MGKHSTVAVRGGQKKPVSPRAQKRPIRSHWKQTVAAITATFAIMFVMVIDPYSGAYANAAEAPNHWVVVHGQTYVAAGSFSISVSRDVYGSKAAKKKAPPKVAIASVGSSASDSAPNAPIPSAGSAKAIALAILQSKGMGNDQYSCLVSLWDRESGWRVNAANSSGAYGIPQALPGSKMASAGPDWQTNAKTQILWGLGYIDGRYGNPCGAWAHSQADGWY
jgi:hypothetical protein